MRQQYHIRKIDNDFHIWNVNKLINENSMSTTIEVPLDEIAELNENYWNLNSHSTCNDIALHAKLIFESDLKYPVLLCPNKKIIDGMHRVCKALLENKTTISAIVLPKLPLPDYINVNLDQLPY